MFYGRIEKMAAATVVRVKRSLENEPAETLILQCKRRKLNEDPTQQISTVLKFAGTIDKDENLVNHIKKTTLDEIKEQFKKRDVNLSEKLREEYKEISKNNRYKIISKYRVNKDKEELNQSEVKVYDIEAEEDAKKEVPNYVYDLYYTNSDDFDDLENEVEVFLSSQDNFCNLRSKEMEAESDDDSEDSNAESNWRNDYPDEEDLESVDEDDMIEAVNNLKVSDDLSSDSEDEGFIYSVDSEAAGFEEDIDESDVHRYGERYARFKARHKKNVETIGVDRDLYYGDIDEDEYYF